MKAFYLVFLFLWKVVLYLRAHLSASSAFVYHLLAVLSYGCESPIVHYEYLMSIHAHPSKLFDFLKITKHINWSDNKTMNIIYTCLD